MGGFLSAPIDWAADFKLTWPGLDQKLARGVLSYFGGTPTQKQRTHKCAAAALPLFFAVATKDDVRWDLAIETKAPLSTGAVRFLQDARWLESRQGQQEQTRWTVARDYSQALFRQARETGEAGDLAMSLSKFVQKLPAFNEQEQAWLNTRGDGAGPAASAEPSKTQGASPRTPRKHAPSQKGTQGKQGVKRQESSADSNESDVEDHSGSVDREERYELHEQLRKLEENAARDRAEAATRLEKILKSIEGLKNGQEQPEKSGPQASGGPTARLKQMLLEVFGTRELGKFATARDKQSFLGVWEFMETTGDYLLATGEDVHTESYEQLTYQAVLIFVATHKHWNNALAVKCDKERWASWSDARRKEWMLAVKARSTKEFHTPEEKKERYKAKYAHEQEAKAAKPSVIVMESRRTRSRSREGERHKQRGRSREHKDSRERRPDRSRSRSRSGDSRKNDDSRYRRTERRRSRSPSRGRTNRGQATRHSPERSSIRRQDRSRSKSVPRERTKQSSPVKRAKSPVEKRKLKCDNCGGDHYANDVAFHPEHPKATKYDRKRSPETPRRR